MMTEMRAGTPITVAGVCFIPIERVRIHSEKHSSVYWFNATKEVEAVVICDHLGLRALDVEAYERSIDELFLEVPELKSLITEFLST